MKELLSFFNITFSLFFFNFSFIFTHFPKKKKAYLCSICFDGKHCVKIVFYVF